VPVQNARILPGSRGMGKARVAAARKLGIRLWIMWRDQIGYTEFCRRGQLRQCGEAHAAQTGATGIWAALRTVPSPMANPTA